jgi:hypothetical protein
MKIVIGMAKPSSFVVSRNAGVDPETWGNYVWLSDQLMVS